MLKDRAGDYIPKTEKVQVLPEWFGTIGLNIVNIGKKLTWRRSASSSLIDVTARTENLMRSVQDYEIYDQ